LAPAIQNKIGQFVSNPLIRNIIGQKKTSFDVRQIMDEKKIFIANLSKGKVGEGNANLLGSLLITKIYLAAMSRADVDVYEAKNLPPCYFYVDEFQNFANESFASILSEARKYKLALTVAHQYIEQMTDEVKSAVFGNVGTMITFRIGATDAEVFEKEFAPYFILDDFVNLSAHQIYLRLMIDDQGSKPFSARTLPPIQKPAHSNEQAVIAYSRATYAKQKFLVEDEIMEFYKPAPKVEKVKPENLSPEMKFLKVSEYKQEPQQSSQPRRNETLKRFDATKKQNENKRQETSPITRYDAPHTQNKKPELVRNDEAQIKINQKEQTVEPQVVVQKEKDQDRIFKSSSKDYSENNKPRMHHEESSSPLITQQSKQRGEQSSQQQVPPSFDEKPAMSLKEALAKALEEHNSISSVTSKTPAKELLVDENIKDVEAVNSSTEHKEEKKRREIAEEVLRKLIEE
jgi:hypothetical protein